MESYLSSRELKMLSKLWILALILVYEFCSGILTIGTSLLFGNFIWALAYLLWFVDFYNEVLGDFDDYLLTLIESWFSKTFLLSKLGYFGDFDIDI